jgi:hypothetical protein
MHDLGRDLALRSMRLGWVLDEQFEGGVWFERGQ